MIGNVWEWTRSHDASYPYHADDGRENPEEGDDAWLVVRGGSFGFVRGGARCAYRLWYRPDGRGSSVGFRVVAFCPCLFDSVL